MYKDIIRSLKIPGLYILMNGKSQELYDAVFTSLINLLSNDRKIALEVESIITDTEETLINVIKKHFPNCLRIGCYFHFKEGILRNLGKLPFIYKGDIESMIETLKDIKKEYTKYSNFINKYFIPNKLEYFKDISLDYGRIPQGCRTNNYFENYNGFIKSQLGKHRIINWANFINFIKLESQRSIDN